MTIDTDTGTRDGTRFGALWAGILVGPIASLVALEVSYVLVHRACATGQMAPVHLSFLACLLATVGAGVLSWREWGRWGGRLASAQGGPEGRSRFLALLGILSSALFALTILSQWSATLYYHPCQ
jgi:hypothetical protein